MEKELNNSDFLNELEKYFKETSREQVLKDWENTKEWDNTENFVCRKSELGEEETLKFVNKLLEFQEEIKSYNKEFNVFGDDITNYDKDYILQHIIINRVGYLKYLNWKLENNYGIFLPEWFDTSIGEIMIKDLYARKLGKELEIEILEDEINKINREIKRYENNSN